MSPGTPGWLPGGGASSGSVEFILECVYMRARICVHLCVCACACACVHAGQGTEEEKGREPARAGVSCESKPRQWPLCASVFLICDRGATMRVARGGCKAQTWHCVSGADGARCSDPQLSLSPLHWCDVMFLLLPARSSEESRWGRWSPCSSHWVGLGPGSHRAQTPGQSQLHRVGVAAGKLPQMP